MRVHSGCCLCYLFDTSLYGLSVTRPMRYLHWFGQDLFHFTGSKMSGKRWLIHRLVPTDEIGQLSCFWVQLKCFIGLTELFPIWVMPSPSPLISTILLTPYLLSTSSGEHSKVWITHSLNANQAERFTVGMTMSTTSLLWALSCSNWKSMWRGPWIQECFTFIWNQQGK